MLWLLRGIARIAFFGFVIAVLGIGGFVAITLAHFGRELPDYQQLANYVPATGSKVYAADGSFMALFETEHRIPVKIDQVPPVVIHAFLAAEDRDFYKHNGVNPVAIFRAAMSDILRVQRGQRPIGASTITQQVVRHFLLTNEVSIARKIKEVLLAYRLEHTLSKDRILDIYLNEIYLGAGAYGVAAAADTYFQKPLDKLTIGEAAFLAALPKAPNNYNPQRHPAAAQARRDWVIAGMADVGWITAEQAKAATAEPLAVHIKSEPPPPENSGYFAEEVRRELIARFGEKAVYGGGLTVRTSYTQTYQQMAETAFRKGLVEYDRRHGWRGPVMRYQSVAEAEKALAATPDPPGIDTWHLAAVTAIDRGEATIALRDGGIGHIPLSDMRWARRTEPDQRLGGGVYRVGEVVQAGDLVLVEQLATAPAPARRGRHGVVMPAVATYGLRQIPDVSGGIVVMDPHTGRVYAMVGGWSFRQSQFNRATQAMRQPGSSFKPFVYITALENGFTPETAVEDAPVSIPQGPGLPAWQPVNYEGNFVGTTTLEDALVHSRNLATVHVAMTIGLPPIAKTVQDFGILDKMPLYYSMVLGAGETTLMRLTSAYAMLDNGGHWLTSSLIDLVQDRDGRIVYQKGIKDCADCFVAAPAGSDDDSLYKRSGAAEPAMAAVANARFVDNAVVYKPNKPDPMVDQEADYELLEMMQGVVQRGTGTAVAAVGKPLAGKTGTTSDWFDAWFVGFSPDLVAGVFVGFDEPRTLGGGEVGGHVAAPIFRDFMMAALKDKPATPFPEPANAAPQMANSDAEDAAPSQPTDMASLTPPGTTPPYGPAQDDSWSDRATAATPYYPAPPGRGYGTVPPAGYAPWAHPPARGWQNGPSAAAAPAYPGYPTYPTYPGQGYQMPGYGRPAPYYPAPQYPMPGGWGARPAPGTGGLY